MKSFTKIISETLLSELKKTGRKPAFKGDPDVAKMRKARQKAERAAVKAGKSKFDYKDFMESVEETVPQDTAVEPAGPRVCGAGSVTCARDAGTFGDRHLWRGPDGGAEARRAVDVATGFAALYPHADLWRRSGAPWW